MKESKRRRSLSGAVLIMILTVMFVLIILLTATLTTVTTANQRIYTKFEESQAYYTARSALDVFTQNMMADSNYWAGKTYNYTDLNGATPQIKNNQKMKQGLSLQFDLYKIHSQCETYGKDALGVSNLKWAENMTLTDAQSIFTAANMDPSGTLAGTPPEQNNFSISSANLNGDPTASKQKDYIEYQVTLPTLSSGSDEYGKFVDVDKSKTGNPQIAKIKVEVLDRVYATEPSYDVDTIKRVIGGGTPQAGDPTVAELQAAIANGSRSKDYMRIKVTSTVTVWGIEGVAVVIVETNEKNAPAGNRAITTTGSLAGGSGAMVRTAGGAATMDTGITKVGDGNNMSGTIFSLGQLEWTSSTDTRINKNEFVVAMGGIASSSNPTKIKATESGTFVFLGETSYLNNGGNFGDASNNIPVVANKIVKQSASDLNFSGDVYVETFESQANNPGKTIVASGHNMYVKNLILDGAMFTVTKNADGAPTGVTIDANELNALKPKFCTGYSIKGTMWDGTQISITAAGATVNGTNVTLNTTLNTVSNAAFDINSFTAKKHSDGKIYREYTLPFPVDGKNTIEVPTAQAFFNEYFKEDAFHETTGDLKNFSQQGNANPADSVNAYSTIYADSNKDQWLRNAADMLEEYLKLAKPAVGQPARTISSMITNNEAKDVLAFPQSGGTINLDGTDKFYKLDATTYSGKVTVTGTSGRLILLIPENTNVSFNNFLLVTDNINETTGTIKNGSTKAPKIDIYGGTGSKISTDNNCLFTAYFIMPTGVIDEFKMGKQPLTYNDGSGHTTSIQQIAVVGSIICKNFKCLNNATGIAYLDKNSGDQTPGEPHLNVQSSQYVRS